MSNSVGRSGLRGCLLRFLKMLELSQVWWVLENKRVNTMFWDPAQLSPHSGGVSGKNSGIRVSVRKASTGKGLHTWPRVLVAPGQRREGEATHCRRLLDGCREPVKVVLDLTGRDRDEQPTAARTRCEGRAQCMGLSMYARTYLANHADFVASGCSTPRHSRLHLTLSRITMRCVSSRLVLPQCVAFSHIATRSHVSNEMRRYALKDEKTAPARPLPGEVPTRGGSQTLRSQMVPAAPSVSSARPGAEPRLGLRGGARAPHPTPLSRCLPRSLVTRGARSAGLSYEYPARSIPDGRVWRSSFLRRSRRSLHHFVPWLSDAFQGWMA